MKRRRFFQYAGFGGLGVVLATGQSALASLSHETIDQPDLGLKSFSFRATMLDQRGRIHQQKTHRAQYFPEVINSVEHLEMVAITPGQFWMGASKFETLAKTDEFPRHSVNLSSFFISKYPITQAQWSAVANLPKLKRDLNPTPSHFQGKTHPVESISWLDAVEFCSRLSRKTGHRYQLPSEAQWEYACRAGTQTPFNIGETITSQYANYMGSLTYKAETSGTYRQSTVPVGQFSPNAFGLHDMHGNVWEWCADSWHQNYQGAPTNGQAQTSFSPARQQAQLRTIRGGSWLDSPAKVRSASRSGYAETALNRTIGFRVITI